MTETTAGDEWRSTNEAVGKPGTYIDVRTVTSYRWLAYKPDGARQMKAAGRWQRATEHGWENATLPTGEFIPTARTETDV